MYEKHSFAAKNVVVIPSYLFVTMGMFKHFNIEKSQAASSVITYLYQGYAEESDLNSVWRAIRDRISP